MIGRYYYAPTAAQRERITDYRIKLALLRLCRPQRIAQKLARDAILKAKD